MNSSLEKYLKYKKKYLNLKKKLTYGGSITKIMFMDLLKEKAPEEYEELFILKKGNRRRISKENMKLRLQIIRDNKNLSNKSFMNLLKENDPEEYKDLFIIKQKDRIKNSYSKQRNNIYSSDISHTTQNGGAKGYISWQWICNNFERKIRESGLSIKISNMSDTFTDDTSATYGGIIFWHNKERGYISSVGGHEIHSIYVLIQNTKFWGAEHFREQGQGRVHDYLYEQVMGVSLHDTGERNAACSSGFSIVYDDDNEGWCIKFSSLWLNSNLTWKGIKSCGTNNSKMTNRGEACIIIGAVCQWMMWGEGSLFDLSYIPDAWRFTTVLQNDTYWEIKSYVPNMPVPENKYTWYDPGSWDAYPY